MTYKPASSSRSFSVASGALVAAMIMAPTTNSSADEFVVATGVQVDFGDRVNRNPGGVGPFGASGYSIDQLCDAAPVIEYALGRVMLELDVAATTSGAPITHLDVEAMPDAPNRYDIGEDLGKARDQLCNQPPPETTVQVFTISYSSCRMTMKTPTHEMTINMPPGGGSADMWMADHESQEVVYTELVSDLDAVSNVIGDGRSGGLQMTSRNHSQEVFGYETDYYDFSYVSEMPLPGMEGVSIPGMGEMKITVENTGEVWVAPNAPGIDIVQSFYRNLTALVQPNQQNSFIAGTLMNLVAMLDYGMPIIIDQTTRSKVMGRTSVSGKSESHIANIRVLPLEADWCNVTMEVPEGYTLTDVNEEINNALTDAGLSQDDMQGMQQMSEDQGGGMSPMDMLGGLFGGDSAGTPGGQAAPNPQGSAGSTSSNMPAPSGGSAGSSMPPAEDLQGASLTESVQKHLEALGYDVGATDGEMSMATTIAISTYQAEKGMEVTGEVSPQLLGILSAEVDSRR